MALSYSAAASGSLARFETSKRRRVLVTGAAGKIGSYFAEHASDEYDLRLMVMGSEEGIEPLRAHGEVVTASLDDLRRMKEICKGVDTVLHLAASADPETKWNDLLSNNIIGTYNAIVAARAAGCRRVIFASSIHAVSGYPGDMQVKTSEPVNPGDLYGVSKCFGEAMGRYMAEQEGLSVIVLRIGAFQAPENVHRGTIEAMDMFCSKRDLQQLICKCIDVESLRWAVFHAVSNNRFKRMDISDARELVGYEPQDDFGQLHPSLKELDLWENVKTACQSDGQQSGIRGDV